MSGGIDDMLGKKARRSIRSLVLKFMLNFAIRSDYNERFGCRRVHIQEPWHAKCATRLIYTLYSIRSGYNLGWNQGHFRFDRSMSDVIAHDRPRYPFSSCEDLPIERPWIILWMDQWADLSKVWDISWLWPDIEWNSNRKPTDTKHQPFQHLLCDGQYR